MEYHGNIMGFNGDMNGILLAGVQYMMGYYCCSIMMVFHTPCFDKDCELDQNVFHGMGRRYSAESRLT